MHSGTIAIGWRHLDREMNYFLPPKEWDGPSNWQWAHRDTSWRRMRVARRRHCRYCCKWPWHVKDLSWSVVIWWWVQGEGGDKSSESPVQSAVNESGISRMSDESTVVKERRSDDQWTGRMQKEKRCVARLKIYKVTLVWHISIQNPAFLFYFTIFIALFAAPLYNGGWIAPHLAS